MRRTTPARGLRVAALALLACGALGPWARPARAGELLANGGFEAGLAGWTAADALGSDGSFQVQAGTASPVNLETVPPPPGGLAAAMTDAEGPGSHVLYQDFAVPTVLAGPYRVSFDLFLGNRADDFLVPDPATLDFGGPALNQQARVDILVAGSDPFSVDPGDVLMNLYQTDPGDPTVTDSYFTVSADVTALLAAHQGQTLRLRFAEVDNLFIFQLGVDNVSVASVPEPSSAWLLGAGAAALLATRRRARARRAIGGAGR